MNPPSPPHPTIISPTAHSESRPVAHDDEEHAQTHWVSRAAFPLIGAGLVLSQTALGFALFYGWIWLAIKVFVVATMFLWVRATFPRYRYDQIMRLGWKVFIPISIAWIAVTSLLSFFGVLEAGA